MENTFTEIYEQLVWGNNNNEEYNGSSGSGSSIKYNREYIPILKKFIINNNIRNIVDLGCGDFRIGKLLYDDLDIFYTGYDTYKKIIDYNTKVFPSSKYAFKYLDFFSNKEKIIESDLCILKDVIQHWALNDIYTFIDYLIESKKYKYIFIVNCCNQKEDNTDIVVGSGRPLSCDFYPLKKYKPIKIGNYKSKEISFIKN